MAKIQTYESQTNAPGVVQAKRVEGSSTDISRGLMQVAGGLENIADANQKRDEADDRSKANAAAADLHARYTIGLQDQLRNAGPNDSNPLDGFEESFQEEAEKTAGTFKTRAGEQQFRDQATQLGGHFQEMAAAGSAELAGVRAKANAQLAIDQSSAAVISDPSSFQIALSTQKAGIDAQVQAGTLPAQIGEQLKIKLGRDLAVSSVRGWAALDPEETKKNLKAGLWDEYLDGDAKKQLHGEADTELRARRADFELQRVQQERAKTLAQKATLDTFVEKMVDGSLNARSIVNSNLDPEMKHTVIGWIEQSGTSKMKDDGRVVTDLFERTHLPDGDPRKIVDDKELNQYVGKGLSMETLGKLRNEIQGDNTAAGKAESDMKLAVANYAKANLVKENPMIGLTDPAGNEAYAKWLAVFQDDFAVGRKAGKSVRALLDPNSPDYIGGTVKQFTKGMQQLMKESADRLRPQRPDGTPIPKTPPLPRQPNESPADYIARKKKEAL